MANHLIHDKLVGAYVYAIKVGGMTRYIGKGRRYRVIEHVRVAKEINRRRGQGEKVRAPALYNRLAKALRLGVPVEYEIIAFGLDDAVAYEREAREIAEAPAGQLWNIHPGGSGVDGKWVKAMWQDTRHRAKIMKTRQETMYGNPEWRERQRENANAQWADPDKRARHYAQHRKLWDDPVASEQQRDILRKVWADPDRSARKRELVKSQWTPERRAAMSENRRKAWANPEFKARASASIKASKQKTE